MSLFSQKLRDLWTAQTLRLKNKMLNCASLFASNSTQTADTHRCMVATVAMESYIVSGAQNKKTVTWSEGPRFLSIESLQLNSVTLLISSFSSWSRCIVQILIKAAFKGMQDFLNLQAPSQLQ